MHPPQELSLAAPLKGHGHDVIAAVGQFTLANTSRAWKSRTGWLGSIRYW